MTGTVSAAAWRRNLGSTAPAGHLDAPLLPTLATKLLEAAGFAALALAVADEF
jgi:hypothetical protein